jgi:hypothetical protein
MDRETWSEHREGMIQAGVWAMHDMSLCPVCKARRRTIQANTNNRVRHNIKVSLGLRRNRDGSYE